MSQTKGLPLQNQESPYVWDMFQDACKGNEEMPAQLQQ